MNQLRLSTLAAVLLASTLFTFNAEAIIRRSKPPKVSSTLAEVCPKVQIFDPKQMFWKNNKPHRASSAINSPVIGYYKQMTLGNNAGVRNGYFSSTTYLYDSKGAVLTRMAPYPCRSDHCGGRVVSSAQTDTTRKLAISRTHSPTGYVKVSRTICVKIDDIGRCYGNEVDKGRPLCNQTVG